MCGQQQQLEQGPKRPADLLATGPEPAQLIVAQDAVSGPLLGKRLHPDDGGDCQPVLLDRPVEEGAEFGKDTVGVDRRATLGDRIDQIDGVALGQGCDRPLGPVRQYVALQRALGLLECTRRSVSPGVPLQVILEQPGESVLAGQSGAPLNTVRSRLRLAKESLRKTIESQPGLCEALEVDR